MTSGVFLMTMTARVERSIAEQGVADAYGHQETTPRVVAESMPCMVLPQQSLDVFDDSKTVTIKRYRMFAPLEADIQFEDEVTRVRDRRGRDVWGNDIRMRVLRVEKWANSHQYAFLEEVR